MNSDNNNADDRLNDALADYMQRLDRGEPVDREAFLAEHADIADQLRAYFHDADLVEQMAGPRAADTLPSPGTAAVSVPPLAKIRYFGDYELLEEIARGGMGVVYRARQLSLNRTVALKMILAGQLASEADVRRFYAEAEAAANLDHPGIVPIFEIGQHEGQHYFSMGFIEGTSLAAKLADGPLPPREAAALLKQVAEAVQYAHQQGVIHRDLKPANVLIDKHGNARVTDFGLAKRVQSASDLTGTGQILGTPSYMAPEQAAGKTEEVRETADVYALGAVLYAMLAGRPPFQADNPLDTLLQVKEREPVSPRQLNPKVPLDLETICLKCLEKTPRRRYDSAPALASELDRYLEGRPILARRISRTQRAWRWCSRNPVIASLASSLVFLLLVGAIAATITAVKQAALRRTAELNLYFSDMKLAYQAWENTDVARVEDILQIHKPQPEKDDLRGWEWYYLLSLCNRNNLRLDGPTCFAVSPVHPQIAVGAWDGGSARSRQASIAIWDLNQGARVATLKGHSERIWSIAWSSDGKRLATGSQDKTVKIWDLVARQAIANLSGHQDGVHSVAFNPDGTRVVSGSRDGTVRVWDIQNQREVMQLQKLGAPDSVAWSPDGQQIAVADPMGGLKIWDTANWQETWLSATNKLDWTVVQTFDGTTSEKTRRHPDAAELHAYSVAWSPDGKRLAAGGLGRDLEPWIVVWNRDSDEKLTLRGHRKEVNSVAWSPDGTQLASGSWDKTIRVWNAADGRQLRVFRTHGTHQMRWTSDGLRIVSHGNDVLQVWNATQPQDELILQEANSHPGITWNADSTQLAVGIDYNVRVWDVRGHRVWSLAGAGSPVAWSPDGQYIAAGADEHCAEGVQQILIWSASERKLVTKLPGHTGSISDLEWNSDGSMLASISLGNSSSVDGKKLKVDSDRVIRVWDVRSSRETRSIEAGVSDYVHCLAWSPVEPEICWARGGDIGIVDAMTGRSICRFDAEEGIRSVGWSPDGKQIVAGFWSDEKFAVFEKSGRKVREYEGHSAGVNSVSWNPHQGRIASASADGTIRIWDVTTSQEVLAFAPKTFKRFEADSVCWSPNGKLLAGWQDGSVKIWDASAGYSLEGSN